jgi:hypothetical protein
VTDYNNFSIEFPDLPSMDDVKAEFHFRFSNQPRSPPTGPPGRNAGQMHLGSGHH